MNKDRLRKLIESNKKVDPKQLHEVLRVSRELRNSRTGEKKATKCRIVSPFSRFHTVVSESESDGG